MFVRASRLGKVRYRCVDCDRDDMSAGDAMAHESHTGHETEESGK
nr:hypothetical protein [Halorubrum sp. T3]